MALDIISNISLDMKAPNAVRVYASQYDSVGKIRAQLLNNGTRWTVPTGAIAQVSYQKSDRIGGYYDTTFFRETAVTVESDRSIITIVLDPQTMTTAGNVNMQVNFIDSSKRLSTFSFILQVQSSAITASNAESKWFINLLATSGILVDTTLNIAGAGADAKATGTAINKKVNKPTSSPNGTSGQLLRTNGDGTTTWVTQGTPTDAQVGTAVNEWLDEHPEATTTVQDNSLTTAKYKNNSITYAKLESPLQQKVDSILQVRRTNCNMVMIGDSWTVGGSASSTSKRFSTLLCDMLNMTEFNFGVGGAGYTRPNNTFISQVETANSSMNSSEKENTGIVAIIGGVNDINHMSDTSYGSFLSAALSCCNKAHQYFPNALIVVGLSNTRNDYYTNTMIHWIQSAQSYVSRNVTYPVLFIKNLGSSVNGVSDNYKSDNLHLTDDGHAKFAAHIANAILGGGQDVFYFIGTPQFITSVADADLAIHIFRENDIIRITPGTILFTSSLESNTLIATLPDPVLAPRGNIYVPTYRSDKLNGSIAFTTSGNIRFVPDLNFNNDRTGAYFPGATWMFNGGG